MSEWWNIPCRIVHERYLTFASPNGKPLAADVLRPETDEVLPGMVCIAGGGWKQCNKRNLEPLSVLMASWGYVTMNLSYRTAPEDRWPCCIQDVKTGVRWLRAHAEQYRLAPERIGAIGNSAGAHLAAMLAMTPGEEQFGGTEYLDQPSNVQAAVCMATPTDMVAIYERHAARGSDVALALIGGTPEELPEEYRTASPCSYVSLDSAPIFFIHGEEDPVVPIAPARELSERLRAVGVDAPFLVAPGYGHNAKDYLYRKDAESCAPQVRDFLAKYLGKS